MSKVLQNKYDVQLLVTYLPITDLKKYPNNPRTHTPKQIQQIAESLKAFGFTNPILLDEANGIIAGHGRLAAAELIGLKTVPTIKLSHLSDAQKRAYIIADNKLAENAGWDQELLKIEFEYLDSLDLDFDLTLTGFETAEIDLLISNPLDEAANDDEAELAPSSDPISRPGDLWLLGRHKLICGDSTKAETFDRLLGIEKADLIFTDPPYNVPIDGHVCGAGSIKHAEFAMASGEMSPEQFTEFLQTIFQNLATFSRNGSIHYICMDWRHMAEMLSAGKVYTELKNLCIWNKTNGGMGSLYRSKHELIFVFKNGIAAHTNNIQLGQHGRYRTNVWDYAGVNSFREDRMDDLASHPTVKPTALVADAILDCSERNDLILDCFGGSGTTLLAAEKTGRIARLIEMDPRYVDVTIRRFQKQTGLNAVHAETRQAFPTPLEDKDHGEA